MTTFTQQPWSLEFLVTEAPGYISRDVIVIASGAGVVQPGTVVGKVTATGKYLPSAATATDGSQIAAAITGYRVDATSADEPVTAFTRTCEVNGKHLTRDPSVNTPTLIAAQNAELAALGISVR
ncbi:bacteriophage lambda head decoration protein D [Rhizobium sp. ERR 1071]|uniref:head decoration protein n=1 Tax=Rhizobium sp. ERR 1071 TaxID=2572677 RepID=UPI00119C3DA0|nr:head decoration protein [Rhizobium sp. ERR1071]TWB19509.1 bacteriophage lambda head decoration protein D [Rhizobium sp. ERR1071]